MYNVFKTNIVLSLYFFMFMLNYVQFELEETLSKMNLGHLKIVELKCFVQCKEEKF